MPFRLRFGEVLDAGYQEFMVNDEYAQVLLAGGMTHVNGHPVRLQVVSDYPGHKIMRWSVTHPRVMQVAA